MSALATLQTKMANNSSLSTIKASQAQYRPKEIGNYYANVTLEIHSMIPPPRRDANGMSGFGDNPTDAPLSLPYG